jgi:hypothetical protein
MLDEIDDILYQWKQNFITREMAEDKILDVVLTYELERKQRERQELIDKYKPMGAAADVS